MQVSLFYSNFANKYKIEELIEKHIVLEDIDPVVFYGVGNGHLQMIKSLFPKLRIVARDNVIRILGDEEEMVKIEEDIETMRKHVERYNTITEEDILDIVKGRKTKADAVKDVLVYSVSGRPIKGRSEHQQQLIDAFEEKRHDICSLDQRERVRPISVLPWLLRHSKRKLQRRLSYHAQPLKLVRNLASFQVT